MAGFTRHGFELRGYFMKRHISIILAILLALSLTACDRQQDDGLTPINEVVEKFDDHFENCKTKEYANLDWTNTKKPQVPQFTECYNIEVNENFDAPSNKEAIAKFESYCRFYFGKEFDDNNVYFRSDGGYPDVVVEGNGMTFDNAGARLNDHRSEIENNDSAAISYFVYVDLEKYLFLWGSPDSNPRWVTRGSAISLSGVRYRPMGLMPKDLLSQYPYETFFNDGTLKEKTYKLYDGDYSIGEAIDYFVNEFYPSQPFDDMKGFSCSVSSVSAIKVKDDMYYYLILFAPTWNSIPFDTAGEMSSNGNPDRYYSRDAQAIMARKNDVDMACYYAPITVKEVGDPINKMLTLEDAADIASETLSGAVKFEVRSAELIYSGPVDSEVWSKAYLHPAWKFTLFNTNDELWYNVYINAVSGECSYYSYSPL